jgi:membrane-associated protease RseP (regulator of RpoE activity)
MRDHTPYLPRDAFRQMHETPFAVRTPIDESRRMASLYAQALLISAALLLCINGGWAAADDHDAGDIVVATTGNDADAGTLEKPFATLARAQQEARASAGRKPVTVVFREGIYYLPDTVRFTAADSGTRQAPVVYRAYEHEHPVISGGIALTGLAWTPYQGGILQAKVPAGFTTDQLFVNGELQPMARYPNFDAKERVLAGWAADAISPERVARWKDPTGGFIHAIHGNGWGSLHYRIIGKGPGDQLIYEGGWQNNRTSGMGNQRFVENIFEELDAPGEWYLDAKSGTLFFYPPAGIDLVRARVEGVRLRHLVEFAGMDQAPVRFITIEGLTFRHAARTFMDNREPLVRSDWTTYRGGAIVYTGTEDCVLRDCFIDQVGGNAVFVNDYNRRLTVRGCHIARAGANGVAFVGDRDAARVPRDWNDHTQSLSKLDRTPGPKTARYPADCLVDDCLIYLTGRVEKQTAPVQIELAESITVRHCSIYDVPRAGINIGDGCWGGHVIEFCDVFDTVKETGDHGSFNSWGRDRFWDLSGLDLKSQQAWAVGKDVVLLDAVKPNILRYNRWRCDNGWDIDLDDGSSNYEILSNLCLHGGIKNREGFFRIVENNVIIGNSFHPHVWYMNSQDVFRHNIMLGDYRPIGMTKPWGAEIDFNLLHRGGTATAMPANNLRDASGRDEHSLVADAQFIDAVRGDFRVKPGSPALNLGFVNFPMDQFGVQKPELKAIARTPEIPALGDASASAEAHAGARSRGYALQSPARDISGLGDRSVYGLADESGVLLLDVVAGGPAAAAGLRADDVIIGVGGKQVRTIRDLLAIRDEAAGRPLSLTVSRKQDRMIIEVADYTYCVSEYRPTPTFMAIPLMPPTGAPQTVIITSRPGTGNDPLASLIDGRIGTGYGPVFGNGVGMGMYKLDLGAVTPIARIDSYSYDHDHVRGAQRFILYASALATDPGWNIDAHDFVPLAVVETRNPTAADYVATSVRRSGGKPLGSYRWLVWAVAPVTGTAGGEHTAFQELRAVPVAAGPVGP